MVVEDLLTFSHPIYILFHSSLVRFIVKKKYSTKKMAFMFAMGHKGSVGALASSLNQKAICLMPNTSVLQNRIDRDLEVDNVLYEACLCL